MDSTLLDQNWSDVCNRIREYENVDASQLNAFFSRLQPQAMSEGFLMLSADNDFIKSWIERHYLDYIRQALLDIHHVPFTVVIEVDPTASITSTVSAAPSSSMPSSSASMQTGISASQPATMQPQQPQPTNPQIPGSAPSTASPFQPPYSDQQLSYDHYVENGMSNRVASQPHSHQGNAYHDSDEHAPSNLTFESFVIGDSNRMAYSMAVNVAENPGKPPLNPLFIYGKSGLGKTHLMRAIQNYIYETRPELRAIYVDSAELLSDYMEASAAHDKEKSSYKNFKTHYEEADVLLIDDIQFLQGKKQTLDIVFQIFNKLIDNSKQIVLSADRAPKNIDIDERYHSRFSQGGIIDIQPPELETKLGIVKLFVEEYRRREGVDSFNVPQDIQMYIAEISSSNIRELKSAITKVIYQITFFNKPDITVEDVKVLLENHFSGGPSKNLSVEDIQKVVENFFKIRHNDLVGPKRSRNIVYPRQIAIYLCRQLLDLPFNYIAKKFNRDHSTAMHSVSIVEDLIRESREVQEEIETLKQMIKDL